MESVLIIGVMTALVFLLWWRQRMQQAHQRQEDTRRREQGLPPLEQNQGPGGNGDFAGWAAGGIGL